MIGRKTVPRPERGPGNEGGGTFCVLAGSPVRSGIQRCAPYVVSRSNATTIAGGSMNRSKRAVFAFAFALAIGVGGCGPAAAGPPADKILFGDNIVTMDPDQSTVEAVAVRGDTITAAGSLDDVMAFRGESTRVVDVGERALLPGFIDAHGHFLGAGRALAALSLHAPPVGDVTNIDEIVAAVRVGIEKGC